MRDGRRAVLLPAAAGLLVTTGIATSLLLYERTPWSGLPFLLGSVGTIACLRLAERHLSAYERHLTTQGPVRDDVDVTAVFRRRYLTYHAREADWSPRVAVGLVWACCAMPVLFVAFLFANAAFEAVAGVLNLIRGI